MTDDLTTKVREQVEFYFSDSNFLSDKFLRTQAASNPEGYVPLATIASFKRMASLTTDLAVVREAVKDSEVVELSEDGEKIRRRIPLPESDPTLTRSIYAKKFPAEMSMDELKAFFSPYGKVLSVRMRRLPQSAGGAFKGSVYVEFASEEEAKSVIEKKDTIKINGEDSVIMWKSEHLEEERSRLQNALNKKNKKKEEQVAEEKSMDFTPNSLIRFSDIPAEHAPNLTRELFRKVCNESFPGNSVKFVDYSTGLDKCFVRFEMPFETEKGSLSFETYSLEFSRLTDAEQKEYSESVAARRKAGFGKRHAPGGGRPKGKRGKRARRD